MGKLAVYLIQIVMWAGHPAITLMKHDAVWPQELSLRLLNVIEARLEKQIMELDTALENSQRRSHSLELESIVSWRNFYGESQNLIDEDYNDNDSWL